MIQYLIRGNIDLSELEGLEIARRDTTKGSLLTILPNRNYKIEDKDTSYTEQGWIQLNPEVKIRLDGGYGSISDYLRENPIGEEVAFGDNKVIVPKLRVCPSGTQLPQKMILTENGVQYKVLDKHLKAWNQGEKLWKFFVEDAQLSNDDALNIVEDVLKVNYRINKNMILLMGLIDTSSIFSFFGHLVDLESWKRYAEAPEQEKKE